MQPLRLLVALASTTLVGIWSSCFAAACNTPYSARFSPRCIAHRARSARIPFQGRLIVSACTIQKAPPLAGELSVNDSEQTEGEYLTALGFFEPFPFRHFVPRTLVGIWSSCFAAACNTPYSARFSPRFIVHRTRSARIPRTRGQLLVSAA